jgi:UDP-N-acetylglucosamine 2-epimerase (non-hydrolysing)
MCPLVKELRSRSHLCTAVCVTGQHREMLDQVLRCFDVVPEYDLAIMERSQTLFDITARVMERVRSVLEAEQPDIVLVQGDTTTTFATAVSAFYLRTPVGHIEAGLRTYDLSAPYPEEFNRQATGIVASYHFAPSELAKRQLLAEGKHPSTVFVTGNTGIDALKTTVRQTYSSDHLDWAGNSRLILMTVHRRESFGEPLRRIFRAIRAIVHEVGDVKVLYPVHLNPEVLRAAAECLDDHPRIRLTEPLDVLEFHNLLARCHLVVTDSGGIQEEAPALGKPVVVVRDTTERTEGVAAGTLRLVGTEGRPLLSAVLNLLQDRHEYERMARASNPYGDGTASLKIANILEAYLS